MGVLASNMTRIRAGGMGIKIDMDPSPVLLVASFNKLGQDIRSFKVPLERSIREVVAPSLDENFAVGGRPPWQPLATQTLYRKRSGGARPLIRTRALRMKAKQLNIWNIDGQEGLATLNLPGSVWYGAVHQGGAGSIIGFRESGEAWGSPGYVPERVWALFQEQDVRDIEKVFKKWVDERVELNLARLRAPRI